MADEDTQKGTEGTEGQEDTEGQRKEKPSRSSEPSKPSKSANPTLGKIIDQIEKLSVLELSQLVGALEEKFGVLAAAPVAVAAAGTPSAGSTDESVSEQTTFNVILIDSGSNKISVIKAVRELVPTLGLKEAKDLVDSPPKPVLEGVNKENANEAKTKLEATGAKVELK